jgi:myo-inositol catabolism protein IolC
VTTIGHPEPLFLFDLREAAGTLPSAELAPVLWEAVLASRDAARLPASQLGVVVRDGDAEMLAAAREQGVLRVLPVGGADDGPFELAHGDGFGLHLEEADATIALVQLAWNAGQPPADKKARAMELSRLAAWLHETDRELLVDLTVPPVDEDLELVGGDRGRFRTELHPALVGRAIQEIRDLGIEPDLWLIELPAVEGAAAELDGVAREAGRDAVALLLPDGADETALRTSGSVTGYRGFVVGPSLWAEPLRQLDAGRTTRDEAVDAIGDAFRTRLSRFHAADGR